MLPPLENHQSLLPGSCPITIANCKRLSQGAWRLCSAKRQPKDPGDFLSYDEAREHLQTSGSGGFSGILNWLSGNAFGSTKSTKGTLGGMCRGFLDSQFVKSLAKREHLAEGSSPEKIEQAKQSLMEEKTAKEPKTEQIATLLVCSTEDAARMAVQYPEVLETPVEELLSRMIFLRELLPRCNIARMVASSPRLFLESSREYLEVSTRTNISVLKNNLEPADVDKMVEEEPDLLFRDLSGCMENLFDLWDIDDATLRNCSTRELALAIKAMSKDGPPSKM